MSTRRLGVAAFLAAAVLVFAACNNTSTTTPVGGSESPTGQSFTTITPGTITIGSCLDYPPFEKVAPGATRPTGFDIELAEAVAAKLGFDQAHFVWVKANFNNIFSQVAQGRFDVVAAAVTATGKLGRQRGQTVAFSDYYFDSTQGFVINKEKTPDITSTDQLGAGDVVGVQSGTTGEDWAKTHLVPQGAQIKAYVDAPQAFTDLEAGNITGVINDAPSSADEVSNRPSLSMVQQIDTNESYAFAFSQDNPALVTAWNAAMRQAFLDGTYLRIFNKYFPGVPVPLGFSPSPNAPAP